MALTRVYGRVVYPHGSDTPTPVTGDGVIEYVHATPGIIDGAVHGPDRKRIGYVAGVAEDAWLKPGMWRAYVYPDEGRSYTLHLGIPEDGETTIADAVGEVVPDGIITRGDPGPAGASVTGGRDNGDGTVSFELSDGTFTDPVTVPPGPAGRGIVSISDPDSDSRVTIAFTDDTTATVQAIRGAKGDKGDQGDAGKDSTVPGPAPTVSWDGDRLVVEGVTGPSLTGPDGPAPEVAWSGDRLIVGGITGPSLTGPASTVPGPPGAVPTADDFLVVGPGRPDAPTTTGLSSAQIAALPVGCEYRSTDGASVGAWVWRKRPTGWAVTEGDTGWRSISLGAPYSAGTTIRVRRTPELVYAAHGTPEAFATWAPGVAKTDGISTNKAWDGTNGFIPDRRALALIFNGGTGATVGAVGWSTEGSGFIGLTHTATSGMVFELQAACTRAWPTALPGTAS